MTEKIYAVEVSIIIPLFNAQDYIEDTLNALVNQYYKNWKCIIVDDHSTDSSAEIAKHFCTNYPEYFTLLENESKGACSARNEGFKNSTGRYIQFLDADDILAPDKISHQLKQFSKYGDDIIVSGHWGRFYQSIDKTKWKYQDIDKDYDRPIDWLVDSWNGKGMAQTSTWLTPRHLIEKAGLWHENLLINQDGEFFCRVLLNAKAIKFCSEAKVYYRSGNNDSISNFNRNSKEKAESLLNSHLSYLHQVMPFLNQNKVQKAIEQLWGSYLYRFWHLYPDQCIHAENIIRELKLKPSKKVGGKGFQILTSLMGLKNALRLKHLLLNQIKNQ